MKQLNIEHDLRVGDILVAHWGYDQTNINFYEVVKVTAKSAYLLEVRSVKVGDSGIYNLLKPIPGSYREKQLDIWVDESGKVQTKYGVPDPMLKRVNPESNGVTIADFGIYAYPWDGTPQGETKAQYGH